MILSPVTGKVLNTCISVNFYLIQNFNQALEENIPMTKEKKPHKKLHKGMLLFYIACGMVLLLAFSLMTFRMVLNSQLNANLNEIRAAGYPATMAELNDYYPAVPDDENAALLYEKAFALYRGIDDKIFKQDAKVDKQSTDDLSGDKKVAEKLARNSKEMSPTNMFGDEKWCSREKLFKDFVIISGDAPRLVPGVCLSRDCFAASRKFVTANTKCIAMLKQAVKYPKCRFPIDLNKGHGILLPHLSKLRNLVRLIAAETILIAEDGDALPVADNILSMLKIHHALDNEPIIISSLVVMAIQSITIHALEYTLSMVEFNDSNLQQINKELESYLKNNSTLLKRALVVERITSIDFDNLMKDEPVFKHSYPIGICKITGLATLDKLKILEFYQQLLVTADKHDFKTIKRDSDNFYRDLEQLPFVYIAPQELLLGLPRVINENLRIESKIKATIIGLAIERYQLKYHKLPERLTQLVPEFIKQLPNDPFTGKPFRYVVGDIELEISEDEESNYPENYKSKKMVDYRGNPVLCIKRPGWMVYSLGEDQNDDYGNPNIDYRNKKGDISFRCVRKNK
jgi:hypothetical protein